MDHQSPSPTTPNALTPPLPLPDALRLIIDGARRGLYLRTILDALRRRDRRLTDGDILDDASAQWVQMRDGQHVLSVTLARDGKAYGLSIAFETSSLDLSRLGAHQAGEAA